MTATHPSHKFSRHTKVVIVLLVILWTLNFANNLISTWNDELLRFNVNIDLAIFTVGSAAIVIQGMRAALRVNTIARADLLKGLMTLPIAIVLLSFACHHYLHDPLNVIETRRYQFYSGLMGTLLLPFWWLFTFMLAHLLRKMFKGQTG